MNNFELMIRVTQVLLFILLNSIFCSEMKGQRYSELVNVLKQDLLHAEYDTQKVRLRYYLGLEEHVYRLGYWDSLIRDAQISGSLLFEGRANRECGYFQMAHAGDPKAHNYLNRSLEIAIKTGNRIEEMLALEKLAQFYSYVKHDNKKALEYCYARLKLAEGLRDSLNVSRSTAALADIYWQSGNFKKSLALHMQSLNLYERMGKKDQIARGLLEVGIDYCALKDTTNTIKYYLSSLNYVSYLKSPQEIAALYNSVAAAYSMRWMNDSAYYYVVKAYNVIENTGYKQGLAGVMATLADISFKRGDYKTAIRWIEQAMQLSKSISYRIQIPDLALILKRIHLHNKNYKEALQAYELYISARDSISNEKNRKDVQEKEFNYQLDKKINENKLLAQQNQIQNLQLSKNQYLLVGLGGIAVLIAIIAILVFRQNSLRSAHQKMQLEQKLISSQMNPHFVFNSLNAIQQMIMKNENAKAELYLSKFATLIRELLESNIKESLTVNEELGILRGYLEMESRRFSKSFHYIIRVDERINSDHTNIPHMMIQPFVENAIWHGLLAKDGDRDLNIYYEYDTDKTIRCVVEDNGVGREVAMKKENTFKKKSLALSFVKQRLELMQETLKVNCYVKIIDKKNKSGESLGTKIIVVLPIIN